MEERGMPIYEIIAIIMVMVVIIGILLTVIYYSLALKNIPGGNSSKTQNSSDGNFSSNTQDMNSPYTAAPPPAPPTVQSGDSFPREIPSAPSPSNDSGNPYTAAPPPI